MLPEWRFTRGLATVGIGANATKNIVNGLNDMPWEVVSETIGQERSLGFEGTLRATVTA